MRNPIDTIKNPKVKSVLITILEILVVAGIIFGVLMFIYSKVNKEADKTSGVAKQEETKVSKETKKYIVSVHKNFSLAEVWSYTTDINKYQHEKSLKCSVGKKVKTGMYNLKKTYSWVKNGKNWHQYNTIYSKKGYLQSVSYKDKYPNTMKRSSYNSLGGEKHKDQSIYFSCDDAKWISSNAYRIKLAINQDYKITKTGVRKPTLAKACGWDPTDPNKNNPYKKQKNNQITFGLKTVTIEKGHKVNYLDNIIAKDAKGNVITAQLKHKKINTKETGSKNIKFTYKKGNLSGTCKFKVVDTTPPKVTIANKKFKFELKSLDKKDVIKQSNIDKIKEMVRKAASCNEPNCVMNVQTIDKEDLNEGDISVVVTAKDKSGNVGAAQTFVKVKVKEDKNHKKKMKFPGQKKKKKHKKKKVVKKHKKKKTKKKKKKQVETETVIEE